MKHEIQEIFKKYDLDCVAVGKVTDDKMLRLLHNGEVVAEVSADALRKKHLFIISHQQNLLIIREFQAMEHGSSTS